MERWFRLVPIVLGLTGVVMAAPRAPVADPTLAVLLQSAGTYLATYEQKFAAVVAHETYSLVSTLPAISITAKAPTVRRELHSDVMMLNLGPAEWVQFRDVFEVNGQPVHDEDGRLVALLAHPANVLAAAHAIANASARYNVGVERNFNVPTMALAYLASQNQGRSTFSLKSFETVDGARAALVEFQETASPGLIVTSGGTITTHGRFWVEAASGAILKTELNCRVDRATTWVTGSVRVDYGREPALDMLVPKSMNEAYRHDTGQTDDGYATYQAFRTFTVDTTAIKRGGGGLKP